MKRLCIMSLYLLTAACGGAAVNEGENYGDLLTSPAGLVLTQEEHEVGWGSAECTTCHNLENIHLVNRTTLNIDIDAIHEQTLDEGIASCAACHGTNGVP